MAGTTLQKQTRERVEELISGLRSRGIGQLPTEVELTERFGVGRNTLRAVVNELEATGMLQRIQGKGTFIVGKEATLRFSSYVPGEIPSKSAFERMILTFQEKHPWREVETVAYPHSQYAMKVRQDVSRGLAPDVIQIAPYWLQRFRNLGIIRQLDEFEIASNLTRRFSKDIESCRVGDEIYALNWGLAPLVLYYNSEILERAGRKPPQTLDELYDAAVSVNGLGQKDLRGICLPLDPYEANFMWLYPFLLAFEGGFSDSIGNTMINTEQNVRALEWLRCLNRDGGYEESKTISDARILFATGHLAFIVDGPYGRGFYRNISQLGTCFDRRYGVTTIPVGPSGRSESMLLAHSLTISTQCRDIESAYAWIDHLTTDEENAWRYFRESGMIPALRDILHKPFFYNDPFASVLIRQIETATPSALKHPLFSRMLPYAATILSEAVSGHRAIQTSLELLEDIVRVSTRIGAI